ncbi:MAG: ankyrin repeat domain-containing protein [Nannocystales bacterium]
MWQQLKKLFERVFGSNTVSTVPNEDEVAPKTPSTHQYEVLTESPWGVPVLDVQPLTRHVVTTTRNPENARNSVSYRGDEGPEFSRQALEGTRTTTMELRIPIDGEVFNGAIHKPAAMEEKWVLFLQDGELLFVRSWTRKLAVRAQVEFTDNEAIVRSAHGVFTDSDETPEYTQAFLEYLLRDYGLGEGLPMPIPFPFEHRHHEAALFAFSLVGHTARFVTHHRPVLAPPYQPLRTVNALHLAVAQKDLAAVDTAIGSGISLDVLATDGLAPMHWAVGFGTDVVAGLLDRGAEVDVRSDEGATPLMQAVQGRDDDAVNLLLERGASARAVDERGFSALHRAAEMGQEHTARSLLDAGADPMCLAGEHTPLTLARTTGEAAIVEMLEAAVDQGKTDST